MKKALKIGERIAYVAILLVAVLIIWSILPFKNGPKMLVVLSGSMEPAIHTGSVVIVKPSLTSSGQAAYKVGDVITFGKDTKTEVPTTHRIISDRVQDGVRFFKTKGDANDTPDVKEVSESEIKGKVMFSVPLAGYVVDFVRKPWGLALVIVLPAAFIVYDEIRKIWLEIKKMKKPKMESENENQNV